MRLGVAGRQLPRQRGDGRLCKPLNKVALSLRLTRSSLASSLGVSQRRVPESQLYALAGDALPWGRRGSEGHRGPSAHPRQKAAPGGQSVKAQPAQGGTRDPQRRLPCEATVHLVTRSWQAATRQCSGRDKGVLLVCPPGEGAGGTAGKGQVGFVGCR